MVEVEYKDVGDSSQGHVIQSNICEFYNKASISNNRVKRLPDPGSFLLKTPTWGACTIPGTIIFCLNGQKLTKLSHTSFHSFILNRRKHIYSKYIVLELES